MLFEICMLFIGLSVTVVFLCFVCNNDFWQGERNTKFMDKLYKGEFDEDLNENKPVKR